MKNSIFLQRKLEKAKIRGNNIFTVRPSPKKLNRPSTKNRDIELINIQENIVKPLLIEPIKEKRQELYQQYLGTTHWKVLSGLKKKIDIYCKKCNLSKNLQIYHTSFNRLCQTGELDDLITLCERCYKKYNII